MVIVIHKLFASQSVIVLHEPGASQSVLQLRLQIFSFLNQFEWCIDPSTGVPYFRVFYIIFWTLKTC